jgi:RIO-like serine/threonine protein kinase
MTYRNDLAWIEKIPDYSENERRILLALSHAQYKWRSREKLRSITGIDEKELDATLAKLLQSDVVVPSFSKATREIIFGLKERVRD